jgi:hypothetical protein
MRRLAVGRSRDDHGKTASRTIDGLADEASIHQAGKIAAIANDVKVGRWRGDGGGAKHGGILRGTMRSKNARRTAKPLTIGVVPTMHHNMFLD